MNIRHARHRQFPGITTMVAIVALGLALGGCGGSGGNGDEGSGERDSTPDAPPSSSSTTTTPDHEPAPQSGTMFAIIPAAPDAMSRSRVRAGAMATAQVIDVDLQWKAPNEYTAAAQSALLNQLVDDEVAGIAISPIDQHAIVADIRRAMDASIPVVVFDTAIEGTPGEDFTAFIETNNREGGRLAAQHALSLLGDNMQLVMLRHAGGVPSITQRESGFVDVIDQTPGVSIIADPRVSGPGVDRARASATNMLNEISQAGAIFAPDETITMGVVQAIREAKLGDETAVIGFGASPALVQALEVGDVDALIVQDARRLGQTIVETLEAAVADEPVAPFTDLGIVVVTKENLDAPNIQQMLVFE